AVRRPNLSGAGTGAGNGEAVSTALTGADPGARDQPYGGAELFPQVVGGGGRFRMGQQVAGRRLAWTAGGTGALVTAMLAVAVGLFTGTFGGQRSDLEQKVDTLRARDPSTLAGRMRGPTEMLERRLKQL